MSNFRTEKKKSILRESAVFSAVSAFSLLLYKKVSSSVASLVFTSYEKVSAAASKSVIVTVCRNIIERITRMRGFKHHLTRAIEKSAVTAALSSLRHTVLSSAVSVLGVFSASFGLYSTVIYLLKRFAFHREVAIADIIVGSALLVLSFFFFSSHKTIAESLYESRILTALLTDFLGIRRVRPEEYQTVDGKGVNLMFILGMIFGLATIVVRPLYIIMGIACYFLVSGVFTYPESGVLILFLTMPFLPTTVLAGLVILVAFSFLVKVVRGKRVFSFSLLDVTVLLFMICLVFGGFLSVFPASSLPKTAVYLCFSFSYFIVQNLISSGTLIRRSVHASVFSFGVVSLIGIVQYFIGTPIAGWLDTETFDFIKGRAVSTWENPNVLGEYLILFLPLLFALALTEKKSKIRFRYFITMLFGLFCLALTWSRGAWIGLILALLVFAVFSDRYTLASLLLASPFAVTLVLLASHTAILSRFNLSDSSTSYRLSIWKGSLGLIRDRLFSGVGIGSDAFAFSYEKYAVGGADYALHSHNLYLQIVCEMGIFALLVFLLFAFVFAQRHLSYIVRSGEMTGKLRALGFFCGPVAFLVQGLTDFVFYNYRITLFFFMLVGLSVSYVDFRLGAENDEYGLPFPE